MHAAISARLPPNQHLSLSVKRNEAQKEQR